MSDNQNSTEPSQPKRRSALAEMLSGGVVGGLIGAITSLFNKQHGRGKQIGIGLAAGAALGLASNLIGGKKHDETQALLPPLQPDQPQGLMLGNVPQVLDMLVTRGQMTPDQQTNVLNSIRTGRTGFSGEIAVMSGYTTATQVGQALADQSAMKAEASLSDINSISQFGPIPSSLRANWGNNGVNPAQTPATRIDGMSASANIAENLVILANTNPHLLPLVRDGVVAAAYLTRGIAQGDSAVVPLGKMSESWRASMNNALRIAAQASPQLLVDSNGKAVDIEQFITTRNAEISSAVQQSLAQGPDRSQGQAR